MTIQHESGLVLLDKSTHLAHLDNDELSIRKLIDYMRQIDRIECTIMDTIENYLFDNQDIEHATVIVQSKLWYERLKVRCVEEHLPWNIVEP